MARKKIIKRVVRKKKETAVKYLNVAWSAPREERYEEEERPRRLVQHKVQKKDKPNLRVCKRCGRRWVGHYADSEGHCPTCARVEASAWVKCKKCHKPLKRIYASERGECSVCKGKREQAERVAGRKQIEDARLNQIVKRIHALQKQIRPMVLNSAPHYLTMKEKADWVRRHEPAWNDGQARIKQEIERLKKELR